jgi:stearoyl-CoA desaturase (delta-9 desaturase)
MSTVTKKHKRKHAAETPTFRNKSEEANYSAWLIHPVRRWSRGLNIPVAGWIGLVHVCALAGFLPYCFSWQGVATCVFLIWMTASLGVCMGYHRLLTHRSFNTYGWMRWLIALIGQLSGEGSAVSWVANHRKHHQFSDRDGDPHSPRDGKWWSHILWMMPNFGGNVEDTIALRYAPDLVKSAAFRWLHRMFIPIHFVFGGLIYAAGYAMWGPQVALSMVVWGMFVRLVYVYHITWFVNSASHMWGYRNYETTDDSRNLWWVGLLAFGEGWHNNHHAYPSLAPQGHKWWEVDMTYWFICGLEFCGLAWDVKRKRTEEAAEGC